MPTHAVLAYQLTLPRVFSWSLPDFDANGSIILVWYVAYLFHNFVYKPRLDGRLTQTQPV